MADLPSDSPLGKHTDYPEVYTPSLLFAIARAPSRETLGLDTQALLPFTGVDQWNAYEVSWLNGKGKPMVGMVELLVPADSDFIVESKSLKLYLGSFNQTRFHDKQDVRSTIESDLRVTVRAPVGVSLLTELNASGFAIGSLKGECIDALDIEVGDYSVNADVLQVSHVETSETLHSHLLRSNCPVTGQPDWASVQIRYEGPRIDRESLLRYLISYRTHNDFHEQCVERIYMDVLAQCQPRKLSVYARYTRRGGIDINPFRSNFETAYPNVRLVRQ